MLIRDTLQDALSLLIPEYPDWYGWAKIDDDGNKIPNDQRMQVKYVIVNKKHEGIVTRPTNVEIQRKIDELDVAEPMRVLREERNRLLAETDWTQSRDVTLSNDTDWKSYRKSLRDLPSTASPKLNEFGFLTNVTWPTKPE